MPARVDVSDPSPEGPFLVEHLRQAGFQVRSVELEDVPKTRADLVILAGDLDGALASLKKLRDDEDRGGVPVVMVGIPSGMEHRGEGPAFGADAVFERPVELAPFLERVRMLLSSSGAFELSRVDLPKMERTMQLTDPADPDSSQVLIREEEQPLPSFAPREPTMQLGQPPTDGGAEEVSGVSRSESERVPTTGASPSSVPQSQAGSEVDAPQPQIPPDERAELSPWLAELLEAADRRVFPDREPLSLHFPVADESPEELVPRELFDQPAFRIDEPVVEDPIDAFTYVGGPAVPPPVLSGSGTGADDSVTDAGTARPGGTGRTDDGRDRIENTTATEMPLEEEEAPGSGVHPAHLLPTPELRGGDWPEDDTVLGRSAADGTRRGTLGDGGALRLLWRVASLGLDAICELQVEGGPRARLTFLSGELRAFEGPVAERALAQLRRRGRAVERPADEAGAQRVLQRRVEVGELSRFERDRMLREAREELLAELIAAERAEFVLSRLEDTEPGRLLSRARALSRPLRAALVEAARSALPEARAIELMGGLGVGLALGTAREGGLVAAELNSELLDLLTRMEGRPLRDVLAEAPTERGLAGILYALLAGDALVLSEAAEETRDPEARRSVQQLVGVAADVAEDGDYFTILGVSPDVSAADLARAFEARRDELIALPLGLLGLEGLAPRREEALDAIEEAYRALQSPARRAAYAEALRLTVGL